MKTRNLILIAAVIGAIVILFYGFRGGEDTSSYYADMQQERKEKDDFMKTSEESPLKDSPGQFQGLNYYEPDLKYRVLADLIPIQDKKVTVLGTSDGKEQRYLEYAHAEFELDGIRNRLLLLEVMDMGPQRGKLFLSFADETSGRETYGAGRYLDVTKVPGSTTITLDFNKAYNPYCAYNNSYSCPFPPAENLLKVAIQAGEKSYH